MTSGSAEGELESHTNPLGHLNGIERTAGKMKWKAAEFADTEPDTFKQSGMVLDQELCPEFPARFFIRNHTQDDVARRWLIGLGEPEEGIDHHRHPTLHVESASSPHEPIDEFTAQRMPGPLLTGCRHYVDVALHQKRRGFTPTRNAGYEVRSGGILGEDQRPDPGGRQNPVDVADCFSLITGRVGRVELNQCLKEVDGRNPRHHNSSTIASVDGCSYIRANRLVTNRIKERPPDCEGEPAEHTGETEVV